MIKCIAIDDEPKALDIIKMYTDKTPFLDLTARFVDSIEALDYLHSNKPDLVFLDINMPDLNGIDFLKSITHKPLIIFTTAYSEYAVESYEYQAVDYLLKPILFNRFLKAVNRAREIHESKKTINLTKGEKPTANNTGHIVVKSGRDIHKLNLEDILAVEGTRNYLTFVTENKRILSLMTMKELLSQLPKNEFIQIHKSFIISLKHIEKIKDNHVIMGKNSYPISATYKNELLKKFQ